MFLNLSSVKVLLLMSEVGGVVLLSPFNLDTLQGDGFICHNNSDNEMDNNSKIYNTWRKAIHNAWDYWTIKRKWILNFGTFMNFTVSRFDWGCSRLYNAGAIVNLWMGLIVTMVCYFSKHAGVAKLMDGFRHLYEIHYHPKIKILRCK